MGMGVRLLGFAELGFYVSLFLLGELGSVD